MLLDDAGRQVGTAAKATVHHLRTPLHLAFSTYVVDDDGAVVLTRRAMSKRTWPGVLTNSCCGHPQPGEVMVDAVRRRLRAELGIDAVAIDLVLPRFRYRASMADGTMENEMCPVFRVAADGSPRLDPAEVGRTGRLPWARLRPGPGGPARRVTDERRFVRRPVTGPSSPPRRASWTASNGWTRQRVEHGRDSGGPSPTRAGTPTPGRANPWGRGSSPPARRVSGPRGCGRRGRRS